MATALDADVHVPGPVILQLRLRGVNIAAATEEGHERKTDEELLDNLNRLKSCNGDARHSFPRAG